MGMGVSAMSRSTSYPAWLRGEEQPLFLEFPRIPDELFEMQRQMNAVTNAYLDAMMMPYGKPCDHSFTLYTVSRGWFCKYCKQEKGV